MRQVSSYQGRRLSLLERAGAFVARIALPARWRNALRSLFRRLLIGRRDGRGIGCKLPHGEAVQILPEFRFVTWNLSEYEAFRGSLAPGAIALDIGANVGAYSLLFGQWVGPAGKVYAFEPEPAICDALRRHVGLNKLEGQVTVVQMAVNDQPGTYRFACSGAAGVGRLATQQSSDFISVDTISVDAFCEREKISPGLIKIDVEGFELAVLRGARETIRRCAGNLNLFVELHPRAWVDAGTSKEEFLSEVAAQNLAIEPLERGIDIWETEGLCVRLIPRLYAHPVR